MTRAFIGVGTNLGDRQRYLADAAARVQAISGTKILKQSSVYETDPVGGPPQGKFLNAVWELETDLEAAELLEALMSIEKCMGRIRSTPNAPRVIDLDLLYFGRSIVKKKGLTVPHPRIAERLFVLEPLAEMAPDWKDPRSGKTVLEMLESLHASHPVT